MNKNPNYKLSPYSEKLIGLEHNIGRAASLYAYPILYNEQLAKEDENSDIARNMLDTSLIKRWGKGYNFNDEPKFFSYFAQHDLPVHENLHGSAIDIDPERAKIKAMGECLERLALAHPDHLPTISASFDEFEKLGTEAINPSKCLNFSQEYLLTDSDSYREVLNHMPMRWVRGTNMHSGSCAYLPYQLAYIPSIDELGKDPIIRIPISTGTACGDSFEDAAYRGMMECIERDSNMLTWLCKRKVPKVALDVEFFKELIKYLKKYNLKLTVWDTTTDLGIPCMLAIVTDPTGIGPAVSAGTKADLNPASAALGAIMEAFHSRNWIRSCYHFEQQPDIKPHQVLDLPSRGFYWYKQDKLKHLGFLNNCGRKSYLSQLKDLSGNDNYRTALQILGKNKMKVYATDISLTEMLQRNIHVVRVIIPEAQPMHLDEDMPYYAGERLEKYLSGRPVNKIPAPYL